MGHIEKDENREIKGKILQQVSLIIYRGNLYVR
jgi:hypothetical protein